MTTPGHLRPPAGLRLRAERKLEDQAWDIHQQDTYTKNERSFRAGFRAALALAEQPREDWSKFDPMRLAPAEQPREERDGRREAAEVLAAEAEMRELGLIDGIDLTHLAIKAVKAAREVRTAEQPRGEEER